MVVSRLQRCKFPQRKDWMLCLFILAVLEYEHWRIPEIHACRSVVFLCDGWGITENHCENA